VSRKVVAWVVAAVVTVALLAGGVLIARDGGADRSPAVLPPLDLGAAGQAEGDAAGAGTDGAAGAVEPAPAIEPAPAPGGGQPGRAGADIAGPWPRVTYRLREPLPSLPGQARAWKLAGGADAGQVAALAAGLGLAGQPQKEANGWTIRDGRRALVVREAAGAPWTYGAGVFSPCPLRTGGGPYRPGAGIQCLDPDAAVSSPPVATARPFPPRDLPSRAEAERVARDLAARAGLDLDGADVRVTGGFGTRTVTIAPAVGGQPTSGFAWQVGVGAKGVVQHASGWLATPVPADTYPLIGVEQGFEQLKKVGPFGPIAQAESPAVELDPCPAGGKVPCTSLAPRIATVTGVRLGLLLAPALATGDRAAEVAYLLPAYLFDLEGGWTDVRAVLAVPERYLTR
jgi:hypothetical protein